MARETWSAASIALAAVGAAALVFALLPGSRPIPLPEGPVRGSADIAPLATATAAVADACARGDLGAFAEATTSAHFERVEKRLAAIDGALDVRTLRAMGEESSRTDWLSMPFLAGEVRGRRAIVAVQRPLGDGAQVLSFEWDGRAMRFDGGRHAPSVRTPAAAHAEVSAEIAARPR